MRQRESSSENWYDSNRTSYLKHQQRALFPKGTLEHHLTRSSAETSEKAPWHLIKHTSVPASITGELKLRNSTHLRKETRPLGTSELQGVSISAVLASALKSSQWKKTLSGVRDPTEPLLPATRWRIECHGVTICTGNYQQTLTKYMAKGIFRYLKCFQAKKWMVLISIYTDMHVICP